MDLVPPLLPALRRQTSTAERCWFAFWEGYSDLPQSIRDAPAFRTPARRYHLFGGMIDDALASGPTYHRAALWWPDDRAWFVGSDTDLPTTYIAGSRGLAGELLGSELEAHEVPADTSFASRGDDVNGA